MQGYSPLHLCADGSIFCASSRVESRFDRIIPWKPCTDLAVALLDHGADVSIRNPKASMVEALLLYISHACELMD